MSGYEVGDRVRVTVEGTVKKGQTSIPGYLLIGPDEPHGWFASLSEKGLEVAEVEKIVPSLPTTTGSVVRDSEGVHWMLGRDGRWFGDHPGDKAARVKAKHMMSPELGDLTYDVILDLGAS